MIMEQQFSEADEAYMTKKIPQYIDALVEKINDKIIETETTASWDFVSRGITFNHHFPANADFLTISVVEALFHKLHAGDKDLAELMLTMMGKQAGIELKRC
ncbi:hypothetical protein SOM41_18700 [Enterobacter sp. CFBP8995]|nr:hypothetical protein [Enterobacter sp. CFBP8995]